MEIVKEDKFFNFITPYGSVSLINIPGIAGVRMSGGWDSSLLCYMLAHCINLYQSDISILPICVKRGNPTNNKKYNRSNNHKVFDAIYKWIQNTYSNVNYNKALKETANYYWLDLYPNTDRKLSSYILMQRLLEKAAFDISKTKKKNIVMYNGVTLNPPHMLHDEETHRNIVIESKESLPKTSKSYFEIYQNEPVIRSICQPFRNVDKRITIYIAEKLKIFDTLQKLTRSCEGNYENTNNFTVECNECWWCKEKKWAIETYDK